MEIREDTLYSVQVVPRYLAVCTYGIKYRLYQDI